MPRRAPTPPPPPAPMPPDVRLMNAASAAVFVLAALALLAAGVMVLARAPWFEIRAVRLEGELTRTNVPTVRANAMPRLAGGFFDVDLHAAREAFESVPWVRQAVVRRVWPDTLAVRVEEHRAVALWDDDDGPTRLVNSHGETFEANLGEVDDEALPIFEGPAGRAGELWAAYQRLRPLLAGLDLDIERLALSGRGSWRVEAAGGAVLELGRGSNDELLARVQRFARTLDQVTAHYGKPLLHADLRHADGYAVRLQGVTTTLPDAGKRAN